MFLPVLQAAISMDPAELEQLQAQAMEAIAQAQQNMPTAYGLDGAPALEAALGPMAAGLMIVMVLLSILGLILMVLNLLNIYHWGMTDKAVFQAANEDKKKWFYILVLVPLVAGIIMIIPLLGWIVGGIMYLYWIVMTLIYFFGQRTKLK
jgi:hypothetical protein